MSAGRPNIMASHDYRRRRPTIVDDDPLHDYFSLSPEEQEKQYKKMTKSQQAEVRMTADGSGIVWLHPDTNQSIRFEDLVKLFESRKAPAHNHLPQDTIVLLSCVKSKRDHPCKAGEMYTSYLFKKMMAYAQSLEPKSIFILSAKYGLLSTDTIIEPYEQTLKNMKSTDRHRWAQDVVLELRKHCDLDADHFELLAGKPYRDNLVPHLKHYAVPMEGLAFGRQLQWLKSQVT
jgi:hypothetical protein